MTTAQTREENNILGHIKLQFHIQEANYDELWLQGYEECLNEVEETQNPFHEGTPEHSFWQEGWWAAFYGEEPLFNYSGEAQITTKNEICDISETSTHTVPTWKRHLNGASDILIGTLLGSSFMIVLYELLG